MSIGRSRASANPKPTLPDADKADSLRLAARRGWAPPLRMSVPEWADKFRKLAPEAGSTSGDWHTSTVEVARGPMLAVTEPGVHIITVMVATQLMKTAFLENVFGFHAHLDPCPMLMLQPKDEAAEAFSKERIAPMIRVTPVLRDLIGGDKGRTGDATLGYKPFPGGFLVMLGAGSPDNLARRPIRVILADEVDKYVVTREGDPIMLAEERTASFVNWLSIRACSPTVEDESRIGSSYAESDQRRASFACPECGHRQFPDFFKHVEWDKEAGRHATRGARMYCEACGVGWSEGQRLRALRTIQWHQTRPFECCGHRHVPMEDYESAWREKDSSAVAKVWDWWADTRYAVHRAKCPDCGKWGVDNEHAGFQASKLYSPWAKDKPSDIAGKWIAAKGDADKEQVWWNTQCGLPHRPHSGKHLSIESLAARCEIYPSEVPDGIGAITVGIDLGDEAVYIETVGWGRNEESWSLDYKVIDGEFKDPIVQKKVDAYLMRVWRRGDGRGFEVMAGCIDSGSGNHSQSVYEFCKARIGRRIWAIKGESAKNGQRSPVWPTKRPNKKNKQSYRPIIIGVNSAKDMVRSRLHIEKPGAGYMHFPADRDINYFAGLTSERSELKTVAGHRFRIWVQPPGKVNEPSDCRNYAYAALCGLMHFGFRLNRRVEEVSVAPANPIPIREVEFEETEYASVPVEILTPEKKRIRSIVSNLA